MTTDYRSADNALTAAGGALGIADAHGQLCALLCARPALRSGDWLQVLEVEPAPAEAETLAAVFAATAAALQGERYVLAPLLPDDDAPLAERVAAAGRWAAGFLVGLGLSASSPPGGDAGEFVRDLAQIAQATLADDDDGEAAERDFAELVEYLRIGVYLVHDALRPPPPPSVH